MDHRPRLGAPRVLIVDSCQDNREVLSTVLQRHGVETFEASRGDRALDLLKDVHPDVVVVDAAAIDNCDFEVCDGFNEQTRDEIAVVLLGSISAPTTCFRSHETIRKPYQYGPLIRKIEELLRAAGEAS